MIFSATGYAKAWHFSFGTILFIYLCFAFVTFIAFALLTFCKLNGFPPKAISVLHSLFLPFRITRHSAGALLPTASIWGRNA